jgi:hypothetical protein
VPVPRQAIRLIAGGLKASVIATMLGHMLRCLYYREHCCRSGGWCKASWIAEVFRVDLRTIKAARKHLVAIGWLQMLDTPQTLRNRWGNYAQISLCWTRAAMDRTATAPRTAAHLQAGEHAATRTTISPPPSELCTTGLPPLIKENKEPFQDLQHQQPAPQADLPLPPLSPYDSAATSSELISGVQNQGQEQTKPSTPPPPTLHHIVLEDLRETDRLLALFAQAQTQGLIGTSDHDRLTFFATAEHARVIGAHNPCGLLAALIRRQLWHYITDSDEDAASARLKQHLYGQLPPSVSAPSRITPAPPELSKDAFMVRELQRELARQGWHGEVFAWVHRYDPTWSHARWACATAELAQAQAAWQPANAYNCVGDLIGTGDCLDVRAVETAEGHVIE